LISSCENIDIIQNNVKRALTSNALSEGKGEVARKICFMSYKINEIEKS